MDNRSRSPSKIQPRRVSSTRFENILLGCLILLLLVILFVISIGVTAFIASGKIPIFPTQTATFTSTPSATPTFTPTLTPTATFTLTPSSTATLTPTPTFTFTPSRTPTPLPTKKPSLTPTPNKPTPSEIFEDTDYAITYQHWVGRSDDQAYGTGMRCSSSNSAKISFTTPEKTRTVAILFFRGPKDGKVKITVDGAAAEIIDLYRKSDQYRFEKVIKGLSNKKHTVEIEVLREKRSKSDGFRVCVDGFRIGKTMTDDTDSLVTYGAWQGIQDSHAQKDTYRIADSKNAEFVFTFKGTAFTWVSARGKNYGQADIYVDDDFIRTIDLYSPDQLWKQKITIDGLSKQTHSIKIVVLGQHNSASNGTGVIIDRITIP